MAHGHGIWIIKTKIKVDIPTFVGFLRDLEQDFQVEDYARDFLGSGKGVLQFAQRFIEMRRKLKGGGANGNVQSSGEKKNKKKEWRF